MFNQKLQHKNLSPLKVVYQKGGLLGIDNIKNIMTVFIVFFIDLLEIIKSKNYVRILETVWGLVRFGNIIDIAKDAWLELKDVDQAESEELYLHFATEFDIENDQVEALIEQAISTIPRIYQITLNALSVIASAREIWMEVKNIFGSDGEIEVLADKVKVAA